MNDRKIQINKKFWLAIIKDTSFPSFIVLIMLIIISGIIQPGFFTLTGVRNNFMMLTPLVFATVAQAIIIISGSLDFSVGAMISFFVCIVAFFLTDTNISLVLLAGFAVVILGSGFLNGSLVGKLKLQPLVATYATQAIFLGIAMYIFPIAGGYVPRSFYRFYSSNVLKVLPVPVLILIIGIIILIFISKTSLYRYIYAVGNNEKSAHLSGINVSNIKMFAFVIASIFVGIAGISVLMITGTGEWRAGVPYLMNSVAATIIGGISLQGGKGNVWGAICGALILGLLNNIIFFAHISSYYQTFVKGMIIFLALTITSVPKLREYKNKL